MITILLKKILEQVKALKTNIENLPSGGNGFIYSFEEQKIGKWFDDDLYSKTYHPTGTFSLNNLNWTDIVDLSDLNVKYITNCILSFTNANEISFNDGRLRYSYLKTSKMLRAASSGGTSITDPYLTIYYTKSTDTEEV